MTSNIYPQYKKMQLLAKEILLDLPVALPIKVKPIIKYILNHENFEIYTYKDYANLSGFELNLINIEKYFKSKDAQLSYDPNNDIYTLLYNSNMPSDRKAWTFAHELGHYFAGHHFLLENNKCATKALNKVFEQEANCFARELLVPAGLVLYIADCYKSRDVIAFYTILRGIFKLSKTASFYISNDLSKIHEQYTKMKIYKNYSEIIQLYHSFIYQKLFSKIPTTDDFDAWCIHYRYEYDQHAFYFYRNNLLTPDKYLNNYLFEKLIQSISKETRNIYH